MITGVVEEGSMIIQLDGTIISTGEALDFTTDNTGLIGTWMTPRPATPDELAIGAQITNIFDIINDPQAEPASTEEPEVVDSGTPGSAVYTVQPGDNLFRIALNNNTCISAIVAANNIPDVQVRNIPVGLDLTIPDNSTCGNFVNDVGGASTLILPENIDGEDLPPVNCQPLQLTSPLRRFGRSQCNLLLEWYTRSN